MDAKTALFWINDTWSGKDQPVVASELAPADQNQALVIGLGEAAQYILRNSINNIEQQLSTQAISIRTWAVTNGISLYGGSNARSAIVSLDLGESGLKVINNALIQENIFGKIINIDAAEPLQKALGGPQKVLRLSAHVYTSDSDIELLKNVISKALCSI